MNILEIKPDSVIKMLTEGKKVFYLDRTTRRCFALNECQVSKVISIIKTAINAEPVGFKYSMYGDYVSRYSFWTEEPDESETDEPAEPETACEKEDDF